MKLFTLIFTLLLLALSGLHFLRINSPRAGGLTMLKMAAGALSPVMAIASFLGMLAAIFLRDPWAAAAGLLGALLSGAHVLRVTARHDGLQNAFGAEAEKKIAPALARNMLKRRWQVVLPALPKARWERDIPFCRIPGTPRDLLCDIWQPPVNIPPSGMAIVFFHGSGWHFLDKDFGTRPFFRRLAAQGHVIMDVAYRLCPETDFYGIAGDAKRAIAWMKSHAADYGADAARIVAMGASAGGHMALLSAYAPNHPEMTPEELRETDLSVAAVVSYYGPGDMRAYHAHAGRTLGYTTYDPPPTPPTFFERFTTLLMKKLAKVELPNITHRQMMKNLFGGQPEDVPERYDLASPITHVTPACPPTLLLQGSQDQLVPVEAARALYQKLVDNKVCAMYIEFPMTEHAFDVALQAAAQHSPAAQAALYDVERFLALCLSPLP